MLPVMDAVFPLAVLIPVAVQTFGNAPKLIGRLMPSMSLDLANLGGPWRE